MRHPKINYQGKQLWLHEIAELNGINSFALRRHYRLAGDDIEKAVAMSKATQIGPLQYIDFFGKKMTITAIAKIYGINYHVLQRAYDATSDIDEAITLCINNCPIKKYKQQKDTVSIHKLKKLAYTFDETRFKVDHTLLNNELDPIAIVDDKMLNENLKAQMKTLTNREQQILSLLYPEDGFIRSCEDVAIILGNCKQNINQIWHNALRKLRHPKLTHYYDVRTGRYSFVADMKNKMSLFSLSEQRLLCLLYGLADGRYHSYPEIAKKFGLSVDRIKILEKNLIGRLDNFSLSYFERYRTELALNSGKERI